MTNQTGPTLELLTSPQGESNPDVSALVAREVAPLVRRAVDAGEVGNDAAERDFGVLAQGVAELKKRELSSDGYSAQQATPQAKPVEKYKGVDFRDPAKVLAVTEAQAKDREQLRTRLAAEQGKFVEAGKRHGHFPGIVDIGIGRTAVVHQLHSNSPAATEQKRDIAA